MAFEITENLRQGLQATEIRNVMVMRFDEWPDLFGNIEIKSFIRIGDEGLTIGNSWRIGGFKVLENQTPYIQFTSGTTTKITQRLDPSRGQGSSVSQMSVACVDKNAAITRFMSPGFDLTEILGREVTIYSGVQESSWPEDYNIIFRGLVQSVAGKAGNCVFNLASTDDKKRAAVLPSIETDLASPLNFRSIVFQSLFLQNEPDNTSPMNVSYIGGATAGSEVVTLAGGNTIQVQIQNGVSTAQQIKKAIENSSAVNYLVNAKIAEGHDPSETQTTGSAAFQNATTIVLDDASFFSLPTDCMRTFVKIEEEIIEYTGKAGNNLTGCTRASLGSIGAYHSGDERVSQLVRFEENGITLALKLMLSGGPTYYAEDLPVKSIVQYSPLSSNADTIYFKDQDLENTYGVSVGDKVTIEGDTVPGNNVIDAIIQEVGYTNDGSYIIVDQTLAISSSTSATAKFKNQYNVLPIGLKMKPKEVDIKQHTFVRDTFLPNATLIPIVYGIPNGKEFLDIELYLPLTCFSVPRKGRSSMVYQIGPLPNYEVMQLNLDTVKNAEDLVVERSTTENFFNRVTYEFDYDPVTDSFDKTIDYDSVDSIEERFPSIGARPFVISSKGLRTEAEALAIQLSAANRFLKRNQYGAAFIKNIQVQYSIGYRIEIGDVVAVDFADLQLSDFETGNRSGQIRLMEVQNKILDQKTGDVAINVVNTIYEQSDRYGLISPASDVGVGSTNVKLILKKSYGTKSFQKESLKWKGAIGQKIMVRSEDYNTVYETVLRGFDNNDPQGMSVDMLPTAPSENWIVELPRYPQSEDPDIMAYWKARYAFFAPRFEVTAGTTQTVFEVAPGDAARFYVGSSIMLHNIDYSEYSDEVKVFDVTGNVITVDEPLGFVPTTDHYIELIGFKDKQPAYRLL